MTKERKQKKEKVDELLFGHDMDDSSGRRGCVEACVCIYVRVYIYIYVFAYTYVL